MTQSLTITSTITLARGTEMPRFGLGVFRSHSGSETRQAVREALRLGYRHIDTAAAYRNEDDVGQAIRESGIPRDEIFVTTKLWNDDQGYDSALRACDASLSRLGLDYVDLYLLHWPVPGKRLDSWRALSELRDAGKVREIGVSNFLDRHLDELIEMTGIVPAVNQFELTPFLTQSAIQAACRRYGIVIEGYSPVARGEKRDDPTLRRLAAKHKKSWAQILIRWNLEHGFVVIPKSVDPRRIAENAQVFDFALDSEDMRDLDALDENFRLSWDPTDVP